MKLRIFFVKLNRINGLFFNNHQGWVLRVRSSRAEVEGFWILSVNWLNLIFLKFCWNFHLRNILSGLLPCKNFQSHLWYSFWFLLAWFSILLILNSSNFSSYQVRFIDLFLEFSKINLSSDPTWIPMPLAFPISFLIFLLHFNFHGNSY